MKKPKKPPTFEYLISNYSSKISEIFMKVDNSLFNGDYLHWDQLRHKKIQNSLSAEENWFGLKLRRNSLLQEIPLKDSNEVRFSFTQVDPIPSILHKIDLGAGGTIQMSDQITNPDTKDRYYVSSLIREAITSSQIEGAVVTRKVAKQMIRSGRKPKNKSEKMIYNNYLTMKKIAEIKDCELTPEIIFELHSIITEGTLDDSSASGRFRKEDELIEVGSEIDGTVYHIPPCSKQLEERMNLMCDFANGKNSSNFIHPVIRAIALHFWLVFDHPFVDGNGRVARALFYWSMLRSGYWLFEFISISHVIKESKISYYRSFLHTETDNNDLTYFIIYNLRCIKKSIDSLEEYLSYKVKEIQEIERELLAFRSFNYRQQSLLSHALRNPFQAYTVESHRKSHNVAKETARKDLMNLKNENLLTAKMVGKQWVFYPAEEMKQKLM